MRSCNQTAYANWPDILAHVTANLFSSYGSGIMPGQSGSPKGGWGIVPLEAWALGGVLYLALAALIVGNAARDRILGFPDGAGEAEPGPAPVAVDAPA